MRCFPKRLGSQRSTCRDERMIDSGLQVFAVIPARGGSKGLPRKNILPLHGKPLIAWTIEAAINALHVDGVLVTSDSEEILRVAEERGASPLLRPRHLASDSSSSEPVIAHAISFLRKSRSTEDFIVLFLQPTSPLRTAEHIDAALSSFVRSSARALISVYQPSKTPFKAYVADGDGYLTGLVSPDAPYLRRQDLPISYYPNGAIYIFLASAFMDGQRIPRDGVVSFEMSEALSLDIDTEFDMRCAEQILSKVVKHES